MWTGCRAGITSTRSGRAGGWQGSLQRPSPPDGSGALQASSPPGNGRRRSRETLLSVRRTRTAKAIIDKLVSSCIDASREAIGAAEVKSVEDVYGREENLIVLSAESEEGLIELEKFLMQNFYLHKSVLQTTDKVKVWLGRLFAELCRNEKVHVLHLVHKKHSRSSQLNQLLQE